MQKFAYREHCLDVFKLSAVGATAVVIDVKLEDINVLRRTIGKPLVTSYQGRYDMLGGALQLGKDGKELPVQKVHLLSKPLLKKALWVDPNELKYQDEQDRLERERRQADWLARTGGNPRQERPYGATRFQAAREHRSSNNRDDSSY